jgi:adenylate kinase
MATATGTALQRFHPRLSFFGSPGSGKGSYSQILARHWGVPILSASHILKKRLQVLEQENHTTTSTLEDEQQHMATGKLLDDTLVSETLLDHIQSLPTNSYILDGFPRTMDQVHLMEASWPQSLRIQAAVHVKVPRNVCEQKLLGRRICSVCGNHYNVHAVQMGGFDLPAKLPRPGECHRSGAMGTPSSLPQQHYLAKCDAPWIRRDDDQIDIIAHRLQVYEEHMHPILDHFQQQHRLFEFIPYRGFQDMAKLQSELEQWLLEHGLC